VPELVAPADGATVSPTPTLRARLSDPDNDPVQAVIEVYRGTDKVRTLETGFVASDSEASVSVDPPLAAGDYTWRARAKTVRLPCLSWLRLPMVQRSRPRRLCACAWLTPTTTK
jgi:hypothetical protein